MMNKRGFTLAELLIVIVILGILGAIALPRFFPQAEKSRVAEAVTMLSAIRQGERAYYLENNNTYRTLGVANDWNQIGLNPVAVNNTYWNYTVNAVTGLATATRTAIALAPTKGSSDGNYAGHMVNLNIDTGAWTGDHPNVPSN